jgi:hypothetical protein
MSFWRRHAGLPPELLDDERTWQGDHDPYLGRLAQEGRRHRAPPPAPGPRVEGPVDDGDPYLAELVRARFARSDGG